MEDFLLFCGPDLGQESRLGSLFFFFANINFFFKDYISFLIHLVIQAKHLSPLELPLEDFVS